jgi:hypothetical protein
VAAAVVAVPAEAVPDEEDEPVMDMDEEDTGDVTLAVGVAEREAHETAVGTLTPWILQKLMAY